MLKELLEVFEMILDRTKTVKGYLLFCALLLSLLSSALFSLAATIVFLERERLLDELFDIEEVLEHELDDNTENCH